MSVTQSSFARFVRRTVTPVSGILLLLMTGCYAVGFERYGTGKDGNGSTGGGDPMGGMDGSAGQDGSTVRRDGGPLDGELDGTTPTNGDGDNVSTDPGTMKDGGTVVVTIVDSGIPPVDSGSPLPESTPQSCVSEASCNPSCDGWGGGTCVLACTNAGTCTPTCPYRSSCMITCTNTTDCNPICQSGSNCAIICDNSDCTGLDCQRGSSCPVTCKNGAKCP